MRITPIDIQEQRFKVRFRGFDVQEVDAFLDRVAGSVQSLQEELRQVIEENRRLAETVAAGKKNEETLRKELEQARKLADSLKAGTKKSADLIIGDAEVQASRMLSRTHTRLSQLHEDIAELKRQRQQIEEQIRAVLSHHGELLEMRNAEMRASDSAHETAMANADG